MKNTIETPILYEQVELKPIFPEGLSEFTKYVVSNYKVPEEDEEGFGVSGVLEANIVISSNGIVTQANILKDVGVAGKQIKKILERCPRWSPGKSKGNPVPVIYTFTITIK